MKRLFLIVLDSAGIGELPDCRDFGDHDVNTIKRCSTSDKFHLKNMIDLGLGNIDGVDFLEKTDSPIGSYGKLNEASKGKDTTTGHWEIAGITSKQAMPTYPNGFPKEVLDAFTEATGRGALCNKPYSGTKVIHDYGQEHLLTGDYIVYTSADSVFQIAAHEDLIPVTQLYDDCMKAREILKGEHAVGRVIARPFTGEYPNFERTSRRHDFSLVPPVDTIIDAFVNKGLDTIGVGKIYDIFAGKGVLEKILINGNTDGMNKTMELLDRNFNGLCFVNLVDFDMLYGHRRDIDGYANALTEFDTWIGEFMEKMDEDDCVMVTADHGCDPGFLETTDHTREYIPFLCYSKSLKAENIGVRKSYADIAMTISDMFDLGYNCEGESFYDKLKK